MIPSNHHRRGAPGLQLRNRQLVGAQLQQAPQEEPAVLGREGERIQRVRMVACLGCALLHMGRHNDSLPYWSTSCSDPYSRMLYAQCTRHCRTVSVHCRVGRALGQRDLQAQGFQDGAHDQERSLDSPWSTLLEDVCVCQRAG
jgi:hypothetical protein